MQNVQLHTVAYDTNLAYIAATGKSCAVLIIVDAISRKYFTGETSWLWDIDFDLLSCDHVKKVGRGSSSPDRDAGSSAPSSVLLPLHLAQQPGLVIVGRIGRQLVREDIVRR